MKYTKVPRKFKSLNGNTSNSEAIAPNEIYFADISDKYRVYDYLEITNLNNDNDAIIILNGSQEQPLPKGTQASIEFKFNSIQIKNNGSGDIEANQIQINYYHISKKDSFTKSLLSLGSWFR